MTAAAVPELGTTDVTARCHHCQLRIRGTYMPDGRTRWWHAGSGQEACEQVA